jgi:RimJ/RimL family protein N-acetyltransferase
MQIDNYWQNSNIQLRGVEPDDWEVFFRWNADSESGRNSYYIPFPEASQASKEWARMAGRIETCPKTADALGGGQDAPHFVGTLNTHSYDPRHGVFRYGIAIVREQRRKGYASQAIKLVLRYYFDELRYQKVTVGVYAFNEPSLRLHQALGFQIEGRSAPHDLHCRRVSR